MKYEFLTGHSQVCLHHTANNDFIADFLLSHFTDGMLFVDVGAKDGFFSLLMAAKFSSSKVLAFEADAGHYAALQKNISLANLKNITGYDADLAGVHERYPEPGSPGSLEETVALDNFVREIPDVPVMVRIDGGGNEIRVMDGMARLMEEAVDLIFSIEFNPALMRNAGFRPEELLERLSLRNYDIYFIDSGQRDIYKADEVFFKEWQRYMGEGESAKESLTLFCVRKNKSLHVCFFVHSAQMAGAERNFLKKVSDLQNNFGVVCSVILPEEGPLKKILDETGISTYVLEYGWWCSATTLLPEQKADLLGAGFAKVIGFIREKLRDINPDVIVTNTIVIPWGAISASMLNKPHVWSITEFGRLDHNFRFFLPFQEVLQIVRESSNFIITVSEAVKRGLFGDLPDERIATVYNWIDIPADDPAGSKKYYFTKTDAVKLVLMGSFSETKGQEDAIMAVRELVERKIDVELLLVGSETMPGYLNGLKETVRFEKLGQYVKFLDFMDDPYPVFRQADIVLMCSRNEAFGRVSLEAMLLRKPVIGTNTGGTLELVSEGVNGFLYDPGDYGKLADRICYFAEHPEKIKEFGDAGYDLAIKNFYDQRFSGKAYGILSGLKGKNNPSTGAIHELISGHIFNVLGNFGPALKEREELGNDLDKRLPDKDVYISELEEALKEAKASTVGYEGMLSDKDVFISELEESLKEARASAADYERRLSDIDDRISELASALKDAEMAVTNLKSENSGKDALISRMALEIDYVKSSLESNELYVTDLEKANDEKDDLISDIRQKTGEFEEKLGERDDVIARQQFLIDRLRMIEQSLSWRIVRRCLDVFDSLFRRRGKMPASEEGAQFAAATSAETAGGDGKGSSVVLYCDRALLVCDFVEVSGWAVSPYGISEVKVYYQDSLLGEARYGLMRDDVQAVFPSIRGSDKSGFVLFAPLDGNRNGSESEILLRVRAVDNAGEVAEEIHPVTILDIYSQYLDMTFPSGGTLAWMERMSENFSFRPTINMVLRVRQENSDLLKRSLEALKKQAYTSWRLTVVVDEGMSEDLAAALKPLTATNKCVVLSADNCQEALNSDDGDFLGFLSAGDVLMPNALFEMVKQLQAESGIDLIYTDEDVLSDGGRQEYFFKPGWSPDLLLSMNYIGGFFLLSDRIFKASGWSLGSILPEDLYGLLLRVSEQTTKISHVPSVLLTRSDNRQPSGPSCKKILEDAVRRRGLRGEVIPLERPGTFRVKWDIVGEPLVSIIIPTAFKDPDLLRACLGSVVSKSTYNNYEIVLIDNSGGKLSAGEVEELVGPAGKIKIIPYEGRFNYSFLNNLAARESEGEYLIFLNDDTEVISPDWIESMLEHAQRKEVGVVGVKLLYQDNTIQHGGIFLADSGGGARHAFRFLPGDSGGYRDFLLVVRNCSAVTFACAMVGRRVFDEMNGFDENLRVECNDVDLCLRVKEAGYDVVWTPFAVLYHKELATRQKINFVDDSEYYWKRWRPLIERGDPCYNPFLSLDADDYSLNTRPVLIEHFEPTPTPRREITFRKYSFIDPESIARILVVKLDHIGDVVLGIPAVKMLRRKYPEAYIAMLVGSWAQPLVSGLKEVDEVLTFDFFEEQSEKGKKKDNEKELEKLKEVLEDGGFDLAVDLRRHHQTREILKLANARYTVGYATPLDTDWLSIALELTPELQDISSQLCKPHITTQVCRIIQALPPYESEKDLIPTVSREDFFPADGAASGDSIARLPEAGFLVGIHPGGGGSIKHWPSKYFARLADLLIERKGAKIVLFGGKTDKKRASEILLEMHNKTGIISLAGEISLEEYMQVVRACHLFIGNDSGPGHIAGALGVPTLAVFGGQILPHEWHPLGDRTLSIRVGLPCAPCYRDKPEKCSHDRQCLSTLWPEKVFGAANQLMSLSGKRE